jgi:hypothetical protein
VSGRVVIVDTNVVIAGLLTGEAASPVAVILDRMLKGAFPFVVSEALLAEYHAVLMRPALRKPHGSAYLRSRFCSPISPSTRSCCPREMRLPRRILAASSFGISWPLARV